MAVDNDPHDDPAKDRMVWRRGDVVIAREDNDGTWGWGAEETKPPEKGGKFVVVKIPGVSLKQLATEAAKRFPNAGLLDPPRDLSGTPIGRRAIKLDLEALPVADKLAAAKGELVATKATLAALATLKVGAK